jgi:murein L,D-transpeptidase YcbB/YkuD
MRIARRHTALLVAGLLLTSGQPATAQMAPSPDVSSLVRAIVRARVHTPQRWARLDDVAARLDTLYESARWAPRWSRNGVATPAARKLIAELRLLEDRGLVPADYDAGRLHSLAEGREAMRPLSASEQADFDVTLSVAAFRVTRALSSGRISATQAHAKLRLPATPYDAVGAVRSLVDATEPRAVLDAAEPPFLHYRLLKQALARYRALSRDASLLDFSVSRVLRAGDTDAAVPKMRRLLVALGDMAAPVATPVDSLRYDSVLVAGVRHFQRRQGYTADGILGPTTVARLRRPFPERIRQIALSLERWRWLPPSFAEPPVIVNVPAFRLYAFASSSDRESDVLTMDVVVGDAFDSRTPVFSDQIEYAVFSPYWNVPPSISRQELLPKARRDPGYLARANYEVVSNAGTVLGTSASALSAVAGGRATIRQRPGGNNALGGVKFIFPNEFNVYLHDTPSQKAFDLARRDVSHGCIRLAEPAKLAQFLLRDQPTWDSARIDESMRRTSELRVNLSRPVPVYIMYLTATAREDGTMLFYDDIYGHDRTLIAQLDRGYPYSLR